MLETKQIPWTEDEENAFTAALGAWVQAWFRDLARTGESATLSPNVETHLALVWRAGREYGRRLGGNDGQG